MIDSDVIAWKTKSEWVSVYEDAYSCNYKKTVTACEKMKNWKSIMRQSFRPGMECTMTLLSALLSDKEVYPDTEEPIDNNILQILYSAAIMRILNLVCDPLKRKLSISEKCKQMGIPEWIANVRNETAHGNLYPDIEILRKVLLFFLNWLKENYWKPEKEGMQDNELQDFKEVIRDKFRLLTTVYVLLKEQNVLGFRNVEHIQDPDIREFILRINEFRVREIRNVCKSWDIKNHKDEEEVNIKMLNKMSVKAAIWQTLKYLKEYLKNDLYSIDTLELLVQFIIDDSIEHDMQRMDIWNRLLRVLHIMEKLPRLIILFACKTNSSNLKIQLHSGAWELSLCQALEKRYKVDKLKEILTRETETGITKPKSRVHLNPLERQELVKILLRKKLNITGKMDKKILACLLVEVEKRHLHLKNALRLFEPKFPTRSEVCRLIEVVALHPNDFSEKCISSLLRILSRPFHNKYRNYLITLHRIYKGTNINVEKNIRKLYTVEDLLRIERSMKQGTC